MLDIDKRSIGVWPLIGLSKPRSATLLYGNGDYFWAAIDLPDETIEIFFNAVSKGDYWSEKRYAVIMYDYLALDGAPIGASMIGISLTPTLENEKEDNKKT